MIAPDAPPLPHQTFLLRWLNNLRQVRARMAAAPPPGISAWTITALPALSAQAPASPPARQPTCLPAGPPAPPTHPPARPPLQIYLVTRQIDQALVIIRYQRATLDPGPADAAAAAAGPDFTELLGGLLRDEGLLLYSVGRHEEALQCLNAYLGAHPSAPDALAVYMVCDRIRKLRAAAVRKLDAAGGRGEEGASSGSDSGEETQRADVGGGDSRQEQGGPGMGGDGMSRSS
jgi:hypothetical protein